MYGKYIKKPDYSKLWMVIFMGYCKFYSRFFHEQWLMDNYSDKNGVRLTLQTTIQSWKNIFLKNVEKSKTLLNFGNWNPVFFFLMKKFFSVVMVSVFLYSMMGFYLNFEIERFRIKEEIKEKIIRNIPENELSLFTFSSANNEKINWVEEGKEFRYHGFMFDVVKIKIRKDITYYYCYSDKKESTLLAHLDKLVKDQTDNSRSRTNQKKQEITYFFQKIFFTPCLAETPFLFIQNSSGYKSVDGDVLSPPPRISA